MKKKMIAVLTLATAMMLSLGACKGILNNNTTEPSVDPYDIQCDDKPVIYLYPQETTKVDVKLTLDGTLTCTYPVSDGTWSVTANPDGTLIDEKGMEYNYLYWEGKSATEYEFSEGFCVAGKDTAAFLEEALGNLGLTRKEANEFIVYWLPRMQENAYNVISFQKEAYTDSARLKVTPTPDTMLRVFMAWKPSKNYVNLPAQELQCTEREGFTVVEWGGTELK